MPGRGGSVCHVRNGFATCPPSQVLEDDGAAPSLSTRGEVYFLDGIAADRVSSVSLTFADGRSQKLAVIDNVFSLESEDPPMNVTWQGPTGLKSMNFAPYLDSLGKLQERAPRR